MAGITWKVCEGGVGKEFAQKIPRKVDYTYMGKIERGEQYPSLEMLEKIGKAFSVPLGYFCGEETPPDLLNFLPGDMKNLIHDSQTQNLLRLSRRLNRPDLSLVMQIISILTEGEPLTDLALAVPAAKDRRTKKDRTG